MLLLTHFSLSLALCFALRQVIKCCSSFKLLPFFALRFAFSLLHCGQFCYCPLALPLFLLPKQHLLFKAFVVVVLEVVLAEALVLCALIMKCAEK